jgi:hypothetical protein
MRPYLAAYLCASLGAVYGWGLSADARRRERDCRASQAEATDALDDAETTLRAARGRVEWSRLVIADEAGRCSRWCARWGR